MTAMERLQVEAEVLLKINRLITAALNDGCTLRQFGMRYVETMCQPTLDAQAAVCQQAMYSIMDSMRPWQDA